ncbi:MAG: Cysteine-tRNA ligase [Parcubacteria group bacterium GW2011_GWA1_44_13]|uniref:Cysteine--tRNA ligase n=1 Tax=Candidatus Nomurabacteria bacterium GW2011_GWB1_44_12 TaxID=1618748 RepID=A0A837I6Q0_9BACT|nr:MAG: Cysteine-tRNA ligase [Candidatus Nomurabacteria bacterium GW2011_GWB1_44_12]KKT38254.1 MAG: Cysteine-tRNA ligase [Parcubacteria group bacterium GW2011_GWA1_44_13]KKT59428.1 MAG: Cysteine-tRNA ligase [Parcubacteria group bacterium GW2011_GWC1_44_26]HBB44067.1 cysteine--tRNA ligase [Candidatus Yonathbacteria bacterium]
MNHDLKLFNTLTRSIEKLEPINDREVRMYNCGPTVYGFAHIGNLRSFIVNDTLRRTLEYTGHSVIQTMNITDIDDKMIARANEQGVSIHALGLEYENFLFADLKSLNVLTPHKMPRATDHIGGMVVMIEKLLRERFAYKASDGIYFEVAKAKNYGALAHLDMDAETESRVEGALDKKSPRDFALWKFETSDDYGNAYDASFGRGRPGWHIECSEMARDTLGETIDIHTGGVDLIFPHHTNEIAQSEAFNGKPFVKIWLHNEFVMVDGQKMSKSLGNHTTLKTITESGFSPLAFRYFVIGAHYRSKLNFTFEALEGAQNALRKLSEHIGEEVGSVNKDYQERFRDFVTQDLDTPRALALAWEVAKDASISPTDKTATLLDFDRVFGFGLATRKKETIPTHIKALAKSREEARENKDWAKSDKIRDEINSLGWNIEDTDKGPKISKLNS